MSTNFVSFWLSLVYVFRVQNTKYVRGKYKKLMGEREKISLYQYSEKWLMFKIKGPNHLTNNVIWKKKKSYFAADSNSYDLEQPETQKHQGSALIQNITRRRI